MTLNYRGFTEEEIQKLIDYHVSMRDFDKRMKELRGQEMIWELFRDIINRGIEKERKKNETKENN